MNYNQQYESALAYARSDNNLYAINLFKTLLKENEYDFNVLYNIARLYYEIQSFDKAEQYYQKILEYDKNNIQVNFDLSLLYLIQKNYSLGFKKYESRLYFQEYKYPLSINYPDTLLALKNKKILIFFEQGFGDSIHFIRFIESLLLYTEDIDVFIQQSLFKIFKNSYPLINFIIKIADTKKYDYVIPLLSLPYILKKEEEFMLDKYLYTKTKDSRIFAKKNKISKHKINIGICWKGESKNKRDIYRSINFNQICKFIKSFDSNNFTFYSFQKENNDTSEWLVDYTEQFDNFYTTSLLVESMDIIISVDTSVLHLAGALGKKTYALIPYLSDWRWGTKGKKNSWYQSVKLIRQSNKTEWDNSLFELKYNLQKCYKNVNIDFFDDFKQGLKLTSESKFIEAVFIYKKLIKIYPNNADILLGYGIVLYNLKKYEKSERYLLDVIKLDKSLYEAYYNLGNLYRDLFKYHNAIFMYKNALLHNNQFVEAINNMANCYQMLEEFDFAKEHFENAIKINPNNAILYENYASVLKDLQKYEQSKFFYQKAILLSPKSVTSHYNYGLLLVLMGDFLNGFKEYEWRNKRKDFIQYNSRFTKPQWQSENLNNKTLLISTEQGMGDSIQFVRYVNKIKEQYSVQIIVATVKPLIKLFKTIKNIDAVCNINDSLPLYDYFVPIMSLSYVLNTQLNTIPIYKSIFKIKSKKFNFIKEDKKFKIGFSWSGSKSHNSNGNRDLHLNDFDALFKKKNCSFYSLQVGVENAELNNSKYKDIINIGKDIKNFYDTACCIVNLDLVISIDSSVSHLAASLDIKTWTILPSRPGFLWRDNIQTSDWYPKMKLFRLNREKEINNIIEQMSENIDVMFKFR